MVLSEFERGAWVGVVQAVVGYPLDTLKVRLQAGSAARGHFFCGVMFPMVASVAEMSIVFGVTDSLFRHLRDNAGVSHVLSWALAGGTAGLGAALPNQILDTFKIRAQLGAPSKARGGQGAPSKARGGQGAPSKARGGQGAPSKARGGQGAPRSMSGCLAGLLRRGPSGSRTSSPPWHSLTPWPPSPPWHRGLAWTALRDGPAFAVYFGTYHALSGEMHPFLAGAVAGWASWAATYPVDAVKTRVQSGAPYDPAWWWRRDIWRGFGAASVRAVLVNGVGFWMYEGLRNV